MLDLIYVGLGVFLLVLMGLYARACGRFERSALMYEPIIGLGVAVLLGAYLVYTLLHPEKF